MTYCNTGRYYVRGHCCPYNTVGESPYPASTNKTPTCQYNVIDMAPLDYTSPGPLHCIITKVDYY